MDSKAQGANGVAQPAGLGAAEHQIGGDALEKLRQSATDVDRVLLDLVEDQVDEELARLDPVEIHTGHPVHPPQRVEDARLEQLVVLRQIDALGGDAPLTTGMSLVLKEKMRIGPMSGGRSAPPDPSSRRPSCG